MTVTFNYNGLVSKQENVVEINLHEDDSHEEMYYKIWVKEDGLLYSEDHYINNVISIEN